MDNGNIEFFLENLEAVIGPQSDGEQFAIAMLLIGKGFEILMSCNNQNHLGQDAFIRKN